MQMIWGMWLKGQEAKGDHTPKFKKKKKSTKKYTIR